MVKMKKKKKKKKKRKGKKEKEKRTPHFPKPNPEILQILKTHKTYDSSHQHTDQERQRRVHQHN